MATLVIALASKPRVVVQACSLLIDTGTMTAGPSRRSIRSAYVSPGRPYDLTCSAQPGSDMNRTAGCSRCTKTFPTTAPLAVRIGSVVSDDGSDEPFEMTRTARAMHAASASAAAVTLTAGHLTRGARTTVRAGAQRRQHALFEPGLGLGRWREEQQLVRHAGEGADLLPAARAFVEVREGGGAFVARQDAERELRRRVGELCAIHPSHRRIPTSAHRVTPASSSRSLWTARRRRVLIVPIGTFHASLISLAENP